MDMFDMPPPDETHKEMTTSRQKRNQEDEESLLSVLQKAISLDHGTQLQNAVTKDGMTTKIVESLLNAKSWDTTKL